MALTKEQKRFLIGSSTVALLLLLLLMAKSARAEEEPVSNAQITDVQISVR